MTSVLGAYLSDLSYQVSTWPVTKTVAVFALSGITSHLVYFIHGDLDTNAQKFFMGFFLVPSFFFAVFSYHLGIPILESLVTTATIWTSFISGLSGSILTYRLFFHPLRNFPGPFGARASKWWSVSQSGVSQQNHHHVLELHKKYGDFVRTGPNEVSIISESVIPIAIKLEKGPWYNVGYPKPSTQLARDREVHRINRRLWDKAFTNDAIIQYLPKLIPRSSELLEIIGEKTPINIGAYFHYYMWDSMGDATFSKNFKMLSTHGQEDDYMRITKSATTAFAVIGHVPYLVHILDLIPFTNRDYKRFLRWCDELVNERKMWNPEKKDVFSWLLTADAKTAATIGMANEARLAILAGSDTTATTLTNICFHLANNQAQLKKLQEEVDAFYSLYQGSEEGLFKDLTLGNCPNTDHLEATIREVLRLHPVVPSSPQRLSPPEGIMIDGKYIPGGAAVYAPMHTMFRDPRYFERPTEFIPERWYKPAEYPLTHKQKVYVPFWSGTWGCVGKPLAMMHLRIVTSRIVRRFSLKLAEGMDEKRLHRETQDLFVLYMGAVDLILEERS